MLLKINTDKHKIQGCMVVAKALKGQGIQYVFGIVGIPVVELAICCQMVGIKYIGMRNEQAASYAASAVGYLTKRPGACLVVSGPGVVNALSGVVNAQANRQPMILIGGANDSNFDCCGGFQECDQMSIMKSYTKFQEKPSSIERIPFYIQKAVRMSIFGVPGPAFIELPEDMLLNAVDPKTVEQKSQCPNPPLFLAPNTEIKKVFELICKSKSPLVIIGKGCAYAQAENEIRQFIEATGLPFIPTPMAKGVVSDAHPLCVAGARTYAFKNCDLVLLLAARQNWILHFGAYPRFKKNLKVIQVDISPEEISSNIQSAIGLCGDVKMIMRQLNQLIDRNLNKLTEFKSLLKESSQQTGLKQAMKTNKEYIQTMSVKDNVPLNYYRVFYQIKNLIPKDCIIVTEGANTMDIRRSTIPNYFPRQSLDAGTFGTMGVGLGYAIAAACVYPSKKIICIEGDSAFGFSGMEYEVACRFNLNITFIIFNNNGIYQGLPIKPRNMAFAPPTLLSIQSHYEKIAGMFGGKGYFVRTSEELNKSLSEALEINNMPTIVNVLIGAIQSRKPQKFSWHTTSDEIKTQNSFNTSSKL